MGKYLKTALIALMVVVGVIFFVQKNTIAKYKKLYNKELQNVKAYRASNSDLQDQLLEYHMTIDDLRASRDSVDRKIAEVIDQLRIKDKKIEYLQYHTSVITKTDTIHTSDTVFAPNVHIDTIVGDAWYNMRLKLDYPSSIITAPEFNSEKYVIINKRREYNKKPSKLFFIRWFQKKHDVVEVDIEEKSPYITDKYNKFIKIIK